MRRPLLVALAATLLAPAAAQAADPIMPLGEVQRGMRCTGLSVVRGLDIASFDVEVIDVIEPQDSNAARFIVRISGPAVDATGLGPGFSGTPVICPGADGVGRIIGAISETVGEYGGRMGLVTPIEAILGQPVLPPAATGPAAPARSSIIGARSLAAPLTIAGLRPSLARSFVRAARKAGRVLIASPAGTRAAFAPQPLVPGASVSVGMTSGDVALGSLGTVAYADGANVWIYGHPLDGAGRRSLFLQDAYVHTVVSNPVGTPDVSTYKLGSPGNDVGTITSDGPNAVVGRLGAPPPSFPLRITAKDLDTGRVGSSLTQIADEGDVGLPTGGTVLGITAAAATAQSAAEILNGAPARQTAEVCMRATVREIRKPLRVCWDYAVDGATQNAFAGAAAVDVASAVDVLESYRFGTLHPTAVEIAIRVRRGLRQAYILGLRAPTRVRRGQTIRLRVALRQIGSGERTTRAVRLRIPHDAPTGVRVLRLEGTPADIGSDPDEDGELIIAFDGDEAGADESGPQSVADVRDSFQALARYDGVSLHLGDVERPLFRDPRMRISGEARVRLVIRR